MLGQHQPAQTTVPTLDEEGELFLEPKAVVNIIERRLSLIKETLIKGLLWP